MKRFLCIVLVLALTGAMSLPAALADEVSEAVEAEVAETLGIDGDTGLTVEGAEEPAPVEQAEPAPVEQAEPAQENEAASEEDAVQVEPGAEPVSDETAELTPDELEPLAGEGELAVAAPVTATAATGFHLSAETVSIGVKEGYVGLTVVAEPEGAEPPAVTWRVANAKIAKVDANGKITGVKKGTTTIYATMENGTEAACKVKVLKAPGKLTMKPSKLTLGADGATAQLAFSVPKGCASNSFTWKSSNTKVAVVDQNGLVTTVGKGSATITVKAYNGKGGKCKLTVGVAPSAIAFPIDQLSLAESAVYKPAPTLTYGKGTKGPAGITYSLSPNSRDTGCLTLNPTTGEMKGVRKGSAIVVATTYNGLTATLPVTVAAAPTGITLSQKTAVIGVKDSFSGLLPTLGVPSGESECASTVIWTSSNKKIAKVDANGVITGVKKGSCTITATTTNGKKASCKVKVYKAPKKITLKPAKGALKVGETNKYKISFPKGCGGTYSIKSSDPAVAAIADDGTVTALAAGTVTVTVTAYNGRTATGKLTVTGGNVEVSLPEDEYSSIDSDTTEYDPSMSNAEKLEYVIYKAQQQLGKPYIYGSGYKNVADPSGFDCSGLVYWSFKQIGITMQDSAYRQGYRDTDKSGKIKIKKVTLSQLKRGDVVCFNTVEDGANDLVDHTGIYLGNGKFIHASSTGKGVVISSLASGYYKRNFSWGRRVLN